MRDYFPFPVPRDNFTVSLAVQRGEASGPTVWPETLSRTLTVDLEAGVLDIISGGTNERK